MTHPGDASGGILIEMVDPVAGEVEACDDVSGFREANLEDDAVLAALDRIASGATRQEALGFYILRVAGEVTA